MKKLIYDYKYKKDFKVGEFFSLLMIEKIKKENLKFDYITFIPTNKITLEKRGFNQCEYLAKKIAEEFNKEVIEILEKRADAKEQKKLLPSERAKNVRRAYYVKNKELELDNKRLLIIDDVMTTGETLKSSVEKIKKYYNIEAFLLTVVKSSI
ncbi:MAG: ComF family protein [Sarcina sp.]